jgi:small-conductance mechanosensitive channel
MSLSKVFWRKKDERSASEVINEYQERIEDFFRDVEGRKSDALSGRGDHLTKLFRWSEQAHLDKRELNHHLSAQTAAREELEGQRDQLKKELWDERHQVRKLEVQARKLEEQARNLEEQVQLLVIEHSRKLKSLETAHEKAVSSMNQQFEIKRNRERNQFKSEENRLKKQLLVNVDKAKAWADDRLELRFMELKSLVDQMAERVELNLPEGQQLNLDFDPSNFLHRAGGKRARFLLKSLIWSVLYERFFALPFGFGVLGHAGYEKALLPAFASWYAIVGKTNATSKASHFHSGSMTINRVTDQLISITSHCRRSRSLPNKSTSEQLAFGNLPKCAFNHRHDQLDGYATNK